MARRLFDGFWMWAAVAMVLVTMAATLCQVLFRYVLELPLVWTEEIARMALVCGVYAALPPAYLRGEHIVVDFFLRMLPPRLLTLGVAMMKFVVLAVVGYLAWGAFLQIGATWRMPLVSVPQLSMGMVYAVQFAALVSLCVAIVATWRDQDIYLSTPGTVIDQ